MNNKKKKIIKVVVLICALIIFIELIVMFVMKINRDRNIVNYDNINDIIKVDDGFIAVGSSDFSNSSFVKKKVYNYKNQKIIATQAKIAKYDDNLKLLTEKNYDNEFDSEFLSIIKTSDGYIAVGYVINKESQIESNIHDALMVKYDNDFKVIWSKTYSVLSDSKFNKIIDDGDGNYVIIGQSIYENMELGNHILGGGIIVRINDKGDIIAHNNYGGNKSGNFNDIIKVDDGYIVCGKDATNYGIVVKFQKEFNRDEKDNNIITKNVMWQRTYSNTDNLGFTSMVLVNKTLYISGALNISDEKDQEGNLIFKYDAGIVLYNLSGKYLGKKINDYDDIHDLFVSIETDGEYLYLIKKLNIDNMKDNNKNMVSKYDLEGKLMKEEAYNSDNNILSKIIKIGDQYFVVGMSDTRCSIFSGCDYEPVIKIYDNKLKTIN